MKSLKYEDSSKNIELQNGFEDLVDHFKSQRDTSDFDREFKEKIEYNISSEENSFLLVKLQTSRLLLLKLINA